MRVILVKWGIRSSSLQPWTGCIFWDRDNPIWVIWVLEKIVSFEKRYLESSSVDFLEWFGKCVLFKPLWPDWGLRDHLDPRNSETTRVTSPRHRQTLRRRSRSSWTLWLASLETRHRKSPWPLGCWHGQRWYWSIPDAWDEGPAVPAHFAWEPAYPKFNPLPLGESKMSFLFGALLFQLQNGRMGGTKWFSVSSMLQFRQSSVGKVSGRYTEKFWASWRRIVSRFTEFANLSTFSTHCNWGVNTLCIFTCFPSQT